MYERAYRQADMYAERLEQLELVRAALYNVARLVRNPLLGVALRRTHMLANTAGLADIHRFLYRGYQAIVPVQDIHRFVETVVLREQARLDRIYETGDKTTR